MFNFIFLKNGSHWNVCKTSEYGMFSVLGILNVSNILRLYMEKVGCSFLRSCVCHTFMQKIQIVPVAIGSPKLHRRGEERGGEREDSQNVDLVVKECSK